MTYSYPEVTYSNPKVTHSVPTHLPLPPPTSPGLGLSFEAFRLRGHPLLILAWPSPELHNINSIALAIPIQCNSIALAYHIISDNEISINVAWNISHAACAGKMCPTFNCSFCSSQHGPSCRHVLNWILTQVTQVTRDTTSSNCNTTLGVNRNCTLQFKIQENLKIPCGHNCTTFTKPIQRF